MLDKLIAAEVLEKALSSGGTFSEIFFEDTLVNSLVMRNDTVETVSSGRKHGAGVRLFCGTRCLYAYTNDTSRAGLLDCAAKVAAAAQCAEKADVAPLTRRRFADMQPAERLPADVEHQKRLVIMRDCNRVIREVSPEIVQAQAVWSDVDQRVWIANSEGLFVHDRRTRTRLVMMAVASDGKENQTGFEGPGAMRGFELFERKIDATEHAKIAAKTALTMLHAPMCPAGVMPVVMAGGFGGVVFHEACGHSLEATSVSRGQSEFCGKLGQQIASPIVTAIDDGTIPFSWGSTNIDDEGAPTTKLVLIENGILKNYMIDKLGGLRMGMPSTGSGRRQDYTFAPTSRMRNTYIAAGSDDDAEMIATMGDGLYAAKMGGGSVNPATGEFNFAVSEGYLVKDGKIAHPVRGASLIGRGGEVLMKIDRVGKDCSRAQGICGSLSGSVPTDVGQPHIRISSMTVGGRDA